MQPLNAVVKNGRLTLDEPTDLPDGKVVVLLPFDEILSLVSDDLAGHELELSSGYDDGPSFIPAPRSWRTSKPVDARSLIDELRSM